MHCKQDKVFHNLLQSIKGIVDIVDFFFRFCLPLCFGQARLVADIKTNVSFPLDQLTCIAEQTNGKS